MAVTTDSVAAGALIATLLSAPRIHYGLLAGLAESQPAAGLLHTLADPRPVLGIEVGQQVMPNVEKHVALLMKEFCSYPWVSATYAGALPDVPWQARRVPGPRDFPLDEPSDYPDGGEEGYGAYERDFMTPIARAHELSLRISTAIASSRPRSLCCHNATAMPRLPARPLMPIVAPGASGAAFPAASGRRAEAGEGVLTSWRRPWLREVASAWDWSSGPKFRRRRSRSAGDGARQQGPRQRTDRG